MTRIKFRNRIRLLFFSIILVVVATSSCDRSNSSNIDDYSLVNKSAYFLKDAKGSLKLNDIVNSDDFKLTIHNASYGLTNSVLWLRVKHPFDSLNSNKVLGIANGSIDSISVFQLLDNKELLELKDFSNFLLSATPFYQIIPSKTKKESTFFIRIKSSKPLVVPLYFSSVSDNNTRIIINTVIFSIYFGIALVMLLYNLFIFISVRDINYFYYCIYILFLVVAQISLQGYIRHFFGNTADVFIELSVPLSTSLVGIFSTVFIMSFLELRTQLPKLSKVFSTFIFIYAVAILLSLFNYLIISQIIIQFNTFLGILFALLAGFLIQKKGVKTALYFNLSWSFFLISVIVYILKDVGILPFTLWTNNSILVGSSLSILLLSFALADKINIYKKEKEQANIRAIEAMKESQKLIADQNLMLEQKVVERTAALEHTNTELTQAIKDLRDAETNLVESEKMASLGQLTAGIAHEINNPINFVTSNVSPLRRDVDTLVNLVTDIEAVCVKDCISDERRKEMTQLKEEADYDYLKEEINFLIQGISDGASRTAEIVKGLRVFSRLDEDDLKKASINDGLNSTLVIVNHQFNNSIQVEKDFGELPLCECYPGKLNQVFLNMLTNAIHAIHKRWDGSQGGKLWLRTWSDSDNVYISIKDNGTGMEEDIKKKIFDPFFTTKEVGEGTGLGMSIAYNTIKKHNGSVQLYSTPGEGTEFVIVIPIVHEIKNL
ncbi:MAG: GHKL domain-containing protein [Bacteroidetes bacterium]|nr:GHKL domain-containing protein [Bacteroidota bacterium]